jgi:amidophosphoribosyltransferase
MCAIPPPGSSSAEAQPFYVNSPYGIVLAHNGNLTNADELKRRSSSTICATSTPSPTPRSCSTSSPTSCRQNKLRIDEQDIFRAVEGVHRRCRGGYAAVAMIPGFGVFGFRDPTAFARWSTASARPTAAPST